MAEIIITTQEELDALPAKFDKPTYVYIESDPSVRLVIRARLENSHVVARGSSHVVARESSHVVARGSSHVEALGSSHVVAWGSSHVEALGSSHVEAWESSHVVARESSHVVARGSSHVVARGSSHVVAWGSSHVEAWESSHVVARESSHVVARGSSHVEALGSSHVVAWGSSHVEALGSSHVVAWGSVAVHVHSDYATVLLFAFACAFNLAKAKIQRKSKTTTIIVPVQAKGNNGWLESQAIKPAASVVLFKRVSANFKTQEGRPWETSWDIGAKLKHPNPDLKSSECGAGKYHACSRPYFCDEFRSIDGDRYIAIKIKKADMYAWPNPDYPHKIGFLAGEVLYEVDRWGERVGA